MLQGQMDSKLARAHTLDKFYKTYAVGADSGRSHAFKEDRMFYSQSVSCSRSMFYSFVQNIHKTKTKESMPVTIRKMSSPQSVKPTRPMCRSMSAFLAKSCAQLRFSQVAFY